MSEQTIYPESEGGPSTGVSANVFDDNHKQSFFGDKSKKFKLTALIVMLVLVVLLVVGFGGWLGARVIGAGRNRLAVTRGTVHTVVLPQTIPANKVEICRGLPLRCTVLSAIARGKQVAVRIPVNYPLGRAYIKVTERDLQGRITGKIHYKRAVMIVPQPEPSEDSSGGSSGGGGSSSGGGGGSSGGGDNSPEPTNNPPEPYEPYVPYAPSSL